MLEGLHERFGVPVVEAYGMTEASHQMTCNPLPPGRAKAGSVGVAAGIDVAILDAREPRSCRPASGVRWRSEARPWSTATRTTPRPTKPRSPAGWFRTGDEGMLDDEGYLYLTGRLKEQINRGGEKISPIEIDEVLLRHPAVAEAVTFAIPHDKLGEEVGAAVVLVEGHDATEAELRAYLRDQLAPFKVPKQIVFVTEIPKGATGKIQRIGLAERLAL